MTKQPASVSRARGSAIEEILPLAPLQEGFLFHSLYDAVALDVYNVQTTLALDGDIDEARLERAAQALLDRHSNLRASFRVEGLSRAVQVILANVRVPWQNLDWSAYPADEQERLLRDRLDRDWKVRFSMDVAPLLRLTLIRLRSDRHYLVVTNHHILMDGWSKPLFLKQLFALYAGRDTGPLSDAPFRDYLAWIARQNRDRAHQEWRDALANLQSGTHVAARAPRSGSAPQLRRLTLPPEATARLIGVARTCRCTLNTIVQVAWAMVLRALTGSDDVVFGSTVSCRPAEIAGIETTVGLFINTVPVRVRLRPAQRLDQLLMQLQERNARLLPYLHVGLAEIQRLAGVGPLFDTALVLENYPIASQITERTDVRMQVTHARFATHYPIGVVAMPGRQLTFNISYRPDMIEPALVESVISRLEHAVLAIAMDPTQRLASVRLMTTSDEQRLLTIGSGGPAEPVPPASVAALIETQIERCPDAVAVTDRCGHTTYGQLGAQAARVAAYLRERGVGPDVRVALYFSRSVEMIMAMLGVWRAAGCYVPIDTTYPSTRVGGMLEDARPALVLTEQHNADQLTTICQCPVVTMNDALAARESACAEPPQPDALAYMIYTSGTTGGPKAVMISHRQLLSATTARLRAYRENPVDVFLLLSPFAFDSSVAGIYWALASGARLHIADQSRLADPAELRALAAVARPTHTITVPTLYGAVLSSAGREDLSSLRAVVCAGDTLPPALVEHHAIATTASIYNEYGATECAIWSTVAECRHTEAVSVGTPIANAQVHVLDDGLRPVAADATGEIYLGGPGVGRGYWQRPALTAERFVANPFGPAGTTLYRTGDIGYRNTDGRLTFIGRVDRQVKLRGFRVELGDVEAALLALAEVREAVAIIDEDATGDKRLVAYVVAARHEAVDVRAMRRRLGAALPDHMLPDVIVSMERLPMTPNGKPDRRALPPPEHSGRPPYRPPRTSDEASVCLMYQETLGVDSIGLDDHFFELGGNSIKALRLSGALQATFGAGIAIRDLFEHPTVAALVEHALAKRVSEVSADPFAVLLPLRSGGVAPAVFCAHPAGGVSWIYSALLNHIPDDRPIYGVQARGIKEGESLPETFEALVEDYVEQILRLQPDGPYHLLGMSLGGSVAHAIACALQARGLPVSVLALIDSAPVLPGTDRSIIPLAPAEHMERFATVLRALSTEGVSAERMARVWENTIRLLHAYTPKQFDGDVLVFAGSGHGRTSGRARIREVLAWWRPYVTGEIHAHHIDADHSEMLKPRALSRIGPVLERALRQGSAWDEASVSAASHSPRHIPNPPNGCLS